MFRRTKDKRKWFDFVVLLLMSIAFFVYLSVFAVCVIAEPYVYDYLHIGIYDPLLFGTTVFLSLLLPLSLCIGCYFSLRIRKTGLKVGISIVCIVLMALWFLPNIVLLGGGGGIASYTTKLDDLGLFDHTVNTVIDNYLPRDFLPHKEILSEGSQYCYYYTYGMFVENYDIQLDAQFSSVEEYSTEKARLMNIQMLPFSEEIFYLCNTTEHVLLESSLGEDFGECVYAAVCFDDAKHQIIYKVFRGESSASGLEKIAELAGQGDGSPVS